MIFAFFMSLLLLITIGGISHPSFQATCHTLLTGCCLMAGWNNALHVQITVLCIFMLLIITVISNLILRKQSFQRSLKSLFIGLLLVILAISLVIYILPPTLFRLEYGIVFSIILVEFFYSILSHTVGGQIVGMLCTLNALTLVIGLNSQIFAFVTLVILYSLFLISSIMIIQRLG